MVLTVPAATTWFRVIGLHRREFLGGVGLRKKESCNKCQQSKVALVAIAVQVSGTIDGANQP